MDKLLLLLLFLGVSPFVFFQGVAPSTICMVCQNFQKGRCVSGGDQCFMDQGPGCRTRDFYLYTERKGWFLNHTEMDCSDTCYFSNFYYGPLKISSFCCKGQDFCNRYQGKSLQWKTQ